MDKLAGSLFDFARKAIVQQLPTAANLFIWGESTDSLCPLCKTCSQTNKLVISNCGSSVALERYKRRHDAVLSILVEGIEQRIKPTHKIFADLDGQEHNPLLNLFNSLRPDIAILSPTSVETLELTICHETNLIKSIQYKDTKCAILHEDHITEYSDLKSNRYTIEVTTLGIISDTMQFCKNNLTNNFSDDMLSKITLTAISNSFLIYCNRNKFSWWRSLLTVILKSLEIQELIIGTLA